jgi:L-2-hydroxyglutarate oxidase LhgO
VAKNASDLPSLDELFRRGQANNIELQALSEAEAKTIEPRVKTYQRALFSPRTYTVNPLHVVQAMQDDAKREGIDIRFSTAYLGRKDRHVITSIDRIEAGYVVNAAGLYADKIAMDYGFSEKYRILPFKGLYLYSKEPPGSIRTNIYPVPDLRNPFLGVHFTITADGKAKIGPTAIPALWRENYEGFSNFKLREALQVAGRGLGLLAGAQFDYRRLAVEELSKKLPHKDGVISLGARSRRERRKLRHLGTPGHPSAVTGHHEAETGNGLRTRGRRPFHARPERCVSRLHLLTPLFKLRLRPDRQRKRVAHFFISR